MKILLVEDETRMADALAQLLRKQNYDVDVCNDGNSGLENMLSGVYDAAVLDVMLHFIDGFTLIETVRKNGITTPALMLTAKGDQ